MTDATVREQCLERAVKMQTALQERGVACMLNGDPRGMYGVIVFLTDDHTEYAPSLFVGTEGMKVRAGKQAWAWHGQLSGFGSGEFESNLMDTSFEWIERHWIASGVAEVADAVVAISLVLRMGAGNAIMQHKLAQL